MQRYVFALGAVLLLAGAGCGNNAPTEDTTLPLAKDAGDAEETVNLSEELLFGDELTAGTITLSAEARGNGHVLFTWDLPESDMYDGFVLVRSRTENPEHTGQNNWFEQSANRRAVTWVDLPTGDWHFRICGLVGNICGVYSNNVTIAVK